jgi:very-short-patch-repair endonuclease
MAPDAFAYDAVRDDFLRARGYGVARFTNADLLRHPFLVIAGILHAMA